MTHPSTTRLQTNGRVDGSKPTNGPVSGTGRLIEDLEAHYSNTSLVKEIAIVSPDDRDQPERLTAVVVPDFEYLRRSHISIAREAVRYALDDLGRELPKERRVRRYIVRTNPLPRTSTSEIDRAELQNEIGAKPPPQFLEPTNADRKILESPIGQIVVSVILRIAPAPPKLHPDMNIEIDLDLDSLARAETFAAAELELGAEFPADAAAQAQTIRELIELAERSVREMTGTGPDRSAERSGGVDRTWATVLRGVGDDMPELRTVLKNRPFVMGTIFAAYKIFNLFCRIFLRLEISGTDRLLRLPRPFLICPNHQSFLDPFIVCSTYSFDFFRNSFHVGASHFFTGGFIDFAARMLHVVPVDADTQLMKAMKAGAIGLKRGKILNIYPEGERAYDGELHEFRNGAAIFAVELGVPIVPVAIDGLHKVWPRRTMRIRPGKVKVRFGEPFYAKDILVNAECEDNADPGGLAYKRVTVHLKDTIASMIREMRSGPT